MQDFPRRKINKHLNKPGWFIRTDRTSLKYGKYGAGPYTDIENIIISMVSSSDGHIPFKEDDETCNIYFLRWLEVDRDKEFRVFVYNNKITAISAQHLYSVNDWLNSLSDEAQGRM